MNNLGVFITRNIIVSSSSFLLQSIIVTCPTKICFQIATYHLLQLGNLKSLEYLVCYKNKLLHLPQSIGELKSLVCLQVAENLLREIPGSIHGCLKLLDLIADKNLLRSLPREITELPNLARLNVCHNHLEYLPTKPFMSNAR